MDINTFGWIFVPLMIFGEGVVRTIHDLKSQKKSFPWKDLISNFSIGLIDRAFTNTLWTGLMFFAMQAVATHVQPFKVDMSAWWAWPLAILLSDFAYYWYHRAGHEIRLFWAVHNVHHSSTFYNFSTSVRLSCFEGLLRWPFWVIVPLAGFSAEVTMIVYLVVRLYQVLLHTEYVGKLGVLEYVLSTPSHHRVHHGRNEAYLDKNYGGITIIWDRLFGTFAEEKEAVDYGLVKQLDSNNLIWINVHEFVKLGSDLKNSRRWSDAVSYVFGRPGWTPEALPVAVTHEVAPQTAH
ncbi:sterol desaturase family protein [Oligoflexus tunisiensis]|uniref:sterol desaturase family protein n=1 Tax=Oligoflexus tunisiensis TaxID=708132 RepID=UPI000A61506C|nr:sterol desaturase family protein [Oligoflexus tunisiensis]